MLRNKRGQFCPMTTHNDGKDIANNIETSNKYQYNGRRVVELDYFLSQLFMDITIEWHNQGDNDVNTRAAAGMYI